VVTTLNACTNIHRSRLGRSDVASTDAETRLVTFNPVDRGSIHGQIIPRQIICAEPSPDVAKAFATAFNMSGSFAGSGKGPNLPADIDAKTAFALSNSRAETLAQMTNRLATIQLLRDGLYRACEAFQNGAISDTTYAVIISRFDKAMVTMLLAELTAGNFGQSLAALGTTSSGTANAQVAAAQNVVDEARKGVTDAQATRDAAQKVLDALPDTDDTTDRKAKELDVKTADANLETATAKLLTAIESLGSVSAAATSNASGTATAAGAITHDLTAAAETRAQVLGTMQRKYIENINADPIIVACITALDRRHQLVYRDGEWRDEGGLDEQGHPVRDTPLVDYCRTQLLAVVSGNGELLNVLLGRAEREGEASALKREFQDVTGIMEKTATIHDKVHEQDKASSPAPVTK
jgi:hypothetical protein